MEVQGDTLFQAASVTKPISAFAALRLVDQGQLSLDSDVDAELQSWTVPASPLLEGHPITLRGILSHSAGLVPGGSGGYPHDGPVTNVIPTPSGATTAPPQPLNCACVTGPDLCYTEEGHFI